MYVMKDEDIIKTGHRSYHDNLWDIPVQKAQIKIDNYIATIPHPSIYSSRIPLVCGK